MHSLFVSGNWEYALCAALTPVFPLTPALTTNFLTKSPCEVLPGSSS